MKGILKSKSIIRSCFISVMTLSLLFSWTSIRPVAAETPPAQTFGIIKGETTDGFPYVSGGVGIDERKLMQNWSGNYNLRLAFTERAGQYLGGVELVIESDTGKEIVNTATNGPWFYIDLPPGTYEITATFRNVTKQIKDLSVSKEKRVMRHLYWDLGHKGTRDEEKSS